MVCQPPLVLDIDGNQDESILFAATEAGSTSTLKNKGAGMTCQAGAPLPNVLVGRIPGGRTGCPFRHLRQWHLGFQDYRGFGSGERLPVSSRIYPNPASKPVEHRIAGWELGNSTPG